MTFKPGNARPDSLGRKNYFWWPWLAQATYLMNPVGQPK